MGTMTPQNITLESTVVASDTQISCDLGGQAAILNLQSGVYYSLDTVAARIWKLLEKGKRVESLRDLILDEYEVESSRCESDLIALLGRLASAGLIEVRP